TQSAGRAGPILVTRARGHFLHEQAILRVTDVTLSTEDLEARGQATVAPLTAADPAVTVDGRVSGTHWETLPGVTRRITDRLRGGRYTARIAIAAALSRLADAPISGEVTLQRARLCWPGPPASEPARAIESVPARYVREGDTIRLSDLRLRGDGLVASGSAVVHAARSPDPQVTLEAEAAIDRWEQLPGVPPALRRFLHGGRIAPR